MTIPSQVAARLGLVATGRSRVNTAAGEIRSKPAGSKVWRWVR